MPSLLSTQIPQRSRRSLVVILIALVLLRSRVISRISRSVPTQYGPRRLTQEEVERAQQELYQDEPDGSKTLLVPFRGNISKVRINPKSESAFAENAKHFPLSPKASRASVDSHFFRQLVAVLRIAVPRLRSQEVAIVSLHSAFLILRTLLSVAGARLDGRIVRDLVSADGPGFLRGLGWWFVLAVPSTYTNSMLRYLQSKLSLRLRTGLTRYVHDLYLSSAPYLRYYRVGHEGGLEGVDQYITSDIAAFCDSLSALYGNVMKPTLDMVIFTSQLSRSLGLTGTVLLFANYFMTASILRAVTPAFGRLAAVEARLEGEYRAGVARVGRESEEIAFYGGGGREKDILWKAYLRLIKHVNSIFKIRIAYEWTEDYVIKYLWSAAGYGLISVPVLFTKARSIGIQAPSSFASRVEDAVAQRTENYISNRRLLLALADAGGRVMYAYKDFHELAGLTTRIYSLLSVLHSLPPIRGFKESDRVYLSDVGISVPQLKAEDTEENEEPGMMLVRPLRLKIQKGEHLMITGPNGVGKTAIARVLAGLWEGEGGKIERPALGVKGVFVVPQRAYMVAGTIRDQIIYPHSYAQFKASKRTDADLMAILVAVHLAYLPEREGGWSTRKEWKDVLSGGEKQRMGMARVFYHRPQFAVLDECTSAVSTDVEGLMYQHAKDLGITLITISHRPSLTKYHTRLLTLTGDASGSWEETRVGTAEERMGLDREIATLEQKLGEVGEWERRIREISRELGVGTKY